MTSDSSLRIRDYLAQLQQAGRYFFASQDATRALGVSRDAAKLALHRLQLKGEIASPGRGLYVIVPPEYRSLGCLPAEQFVPNMMARLKLPYYAGLLSAAQYHGAAHHRPQEFQVMVGKARRPIQCGQVRVVYRVHKRIANVPVQHINTPRGTVAVSTPEATALDLVGYETHIGGLDAVATVLVDLAARIDADKLAALAPDVPLPWVQRLGYLLEQVGEAPIAVTLKAYVRDHAREAAPLVPSAPVEGQPRNPDWKLIVNATVQAEA